MTGIILLIFGLMIFTAIWQAKDRSLSPLSNWRPKYLSLENPFIPPPLTAKEIKHNLDQSEASESDFENGIISSKVLYDRLEDQNLQLASQIQKHQEELDAYFSKMAAEADKEGFSMFGPGILGPIASFLNGSLLG